MARIRVIRHEAENTVVKPKVNIDLAHKLRVAAYCRVSTLEEEQELSYEAQKDYYQALFAKDDKYYLVGVYGDQGVSGLKAAKRPQFQELLKACRNGRIDEIYTKSISRFARNFSECLACVRELKSLGIVVHFEKEGISTADENTEMILTFMSILAQEEINSISQNVGVIIQHRSRAGDPVRAASYGYVRDKLLSDGIHRWHINTEQAIRIKMIYKLFLEGKRYGEIVEALADFEKEHGVTQKWTICKVKGILQSEVYAGDILTFKTYTADYLTKKIVRNKGEREQQYIKDHHPGIISREQDQAVKDILARRSRHDKQRISS